MEGGVFSRDRFAFAEFLSRHGADGAEGDRRFIARNFLLDEGVVPDRAATYESSKDGSVPASFVAWRDSHLEYLLQQVQLDQPPGGPPHTLNPANEALCPRTFRHPEVFRAFGSALPSLDLLRVVSAQRIVRRLRPLGIREEDLLAWAREAVESRDSGSEAWQRLDSVLQTWSSLLDLRPVYVGFWDDQKALFGIRPSEDLPGWADVLRDRLGLLHLAPDRRSGAIPILVFRYSVGSVPKRAGLRGRPLAVPTVLDSDFSEAFCPAPQDEHYGRAVDLSASLDESSREVLHPFLPYSAGQLFRVGRIEAPSGPVGTARTAHLMALRERCSRPEYAAGTDGDLLGP